MAEGDISTLELRIARLEGGYEQQDKRLGNIEAELRHLGQRIDALIEHFDQRLDAQAQQINQRLDAQAQDFNQRLDAFEKRLGSLAWRLVALMLTSWITLFAAILLHH